jgi:hypothetical protein
LDSPLNRKGFTIELGSVLCGSEIQEFRVCVDAIRRGSHFAIRVGMNYRDRLSATQGKETVGSCLELGHTTIWVLGTSTISYYQEMAAEEQPTVLGPYDRAERLYDKKTLPYTRSPITALRSFFGIAILVGSFTLLPHTLSSAAELFPFIPPSSQQRSIDQEPIARPQLSSEDEKRISRIADQAKQLSPTDRNQLKNSIQKNLDDAFAKGNLSQAKYFSELRRQIE